MSASNFFLVLVNVLRVCALTCAISGTALHIARIIIRASGKLFQVLSKMSVAAFFVLDHLKWLQMHRFVPGEWQKTGIRGLKMFTVGQAFGWLYAVKTVMHERSNIKSLKMAATRKKAIGHEISEDDAQRLAEAKTRLAAASRSTFKLTLTVIQGLHISKVYEGTGDMFAGSIGVLTSYMECCDLWPKLQKWKAA